MVMHRKYLRLLQIGDQSGAKNGTIETFSYAGSLQSSIPWKHVLKDVAILDGVTVTMDPSKENEIKALFTNGNTLVFKGCNDGLYHLNIKDIKRDVMDYSYLQTFN